MVDGNDDLPTHSGRRLLREELPHFHCVGQGPIHIHDRRPCISGFEGRATSTRLYPARTKVPHPCGRDHRYEAVHALSPV